jgi:hypothetical protein
LKSTKEVFKEIFEEATKDLEKWIFLLLKLQSFCWKNKFSNI